MERYPNKFVFHIPCYAWENGKLEPVNYGLFQMRFGEQLEKIGIDSWYTIRAEGQYHGRNYEEVLMCVFCSDALKDGAEMCFRSVCKEYGHLLRQEAFAYEKCGELFVFDAEE